MSETLPGRIPSLPAPVRRAASLADGIRKAQQAAGAPAALPVTIVPDVVQAPVVTTPLPPVAAPLSPTPISADSLRSRLVELFHNSQPTLAAFYQYSQTAAALAEEYHEARLRENYPGVVFEELTLAATLDARETPATLDKKLAELQGVGIRKVVYDRVKTSYYLYV